MTASALISIQDGSGAIENQGQGYVQQLTPSDVITFALQSTAGFVPGLRWVLQFESPDTPNLNGLQFIWDPRTLAPASFSFTAPPGGFTARYFTTVQDAQNILSQFTGEIFGGTGINISPAALDGQAPVWTGTSYTPQGHHSCVNILSYGAVADGVTSCGAAIQAASDAAAAAGLPLYFPTSGIHSYRIEQPIFLKSSSIWEGEASTAPLASLTYQDPTGLYWGGGHVGEIALMMPASIHNTLYTTTGGFTWLQMGGSSSTGAQPLFYLSEVPSGSFHGLADFTFEFRLNITTAPISANADLFYVGGSKTQNSGLTSAFSLNTSGLGTTPTDLTASIHTTGGTFTCTTTSHPLNFPADHAIAVDYDGAHLRIYVDGVVPTGGSVAATGTLIQNWWEDAVFGQTSANGQYPMGGLTPVGANPQRIAAIRKSNIARYAGTPYTPKTADWQIADIDNNTDLVVSFASAFIPTRAPSMVVATCGNPSTWGLTVSAPANVWMPIRGVCSISTDSSASGCVFRYLSMSSWNGCASGELAVATRFVECSFSGRKGITMMNNSFYSESYRCIYSVTGGPASPHPSSSHSWGEAHLLLSGISVIDSPRFTGVTTAQHGFVFNSSSGTIRDPKINSVGGQTGAYFNNSEMLILGGGWADEGGGVLTALVVATYNTSGTGSGNSIIWKGGGLFEESGTSATCCILTDAGVNYSFDLDLGGTNSSALIKSINAPLYPIQLHNSYQGQGINGPIPWSDGTAPVIVAPLERNVRSTWNATGSGSITCQWCNPAVFSGDSPTGPDFSCSDIVITDSGSHLTGTTAVVAPTKLVGYKRWVTAPSTQAITFGATTGATVTIASGKTACVRSNGSGWERVSPDT